MSSKLRYCSTPQTPLAAVACCTPSQPNVTINERLSITSVYEIASRARSKLGDEVDRNNQDLRRMVGHANLLDALMVELFDSDVARDDWLYQDMRTVSVKVESRCLQRIDHILDKIDDDGNKSDEHDDDSQSDEDCTSDELDAHLFNSPLCRVKSRPPWRGDDSIEVQEVKIIADKFQMLDLHDIIPAQVGHSTSATMNNIEAIAKSTSNVIVIQTYEVDEL